MYKRMDCSDDNTRGWGALDFDMQDPNCLSLPKSLGWTNQDSESMTLTSQEKIDACLLSRHCGTEEATNRTFKPIMQANFLEKDHHQARNQEIGNDLPFLGREQGFFVTIPTDGAI